MNGWNELSPTLQWAVLGLGAAQVLLALCALASWARTPAERMSLPRLAWALVILLVNGIGPIAWFVAGRRPAPPEEATTGPGPQAPGHGERQRHAVEVLYGPGRES